MGSEDEQLDRALSMSQIYDGNRRGLGSQPRPQLRPQSRPPDLNEAATCLMIAQLQAEHWLHVHDEEAADEELIRMLMEEDTSMFEQ